MSFPMAAAWEEVVNKLAGKGLKMPSSEIWPHPLGNRESWKVWE